MYAYVLLFLLAIGDCSSGLWKITEMSNINHYPRRDFDFIETHAKDFTFTPFSYGKFGWSVDIFNVSILDVVNKGIDPGKMTVDKNSISWTMDEAFYIDIDFSYVHNVGVLLMSGKAKIYLHCDQATYTMHVTNNDIKPTIHCQSWLYKDIKITKGVDWASIRNHIVETLNGDYQVQTFFANKFANVLDNYYHEEYRDKTGLLVFEKMQTKINVLFKLLDVHTNVNERTLEFDYQIDLKPYPIMSNSMLSIAKPSVFAPKEYSRMYFIGRQMILDVANIILPKYINKAIFPIDVPADSYWTLKLWSLQKVMPDLLLLLPDQDLVPFHINIDYLPALSTPVLEVVKHFDDFPYYRVSNLTFQIELIKQGSTAYLMKALISVWADLAPVVTEVAENNLVVASFNAIRGDATAYNVEDWHEGGFVTPRGLDEFLDEGLNDYMIKQLGHQVFGSGLMFQDFSHKGKIEYFEPMEDGLYIYLN